MAGEFRGYTVQTQLVTAQTGGHPIPVVMPADVDPGDYLFIVGGNAAINYIGIDSVVIDSELRFFAAGASDWEALTGAPNIFVKIADGTEGGTTVTLESANTDFSGDQDEPPRVSVLVAMCYRFPTPPVYDLDVGKGPNKEFIVYQDEFIDDFPPVDSADEIGSYPGDVSVPQEFRLIAFVGQGTPTALFDDTDPLDSATWYGPEIVDRTGLQSLEGVPDPDSGITVDTSSVTVADQTYLFGNSSPLTGIVLAYSGYRASGFLNAVGLVWAVATFRAYWGVDAGPN